MLSSNETKSAVAQFGSYVVEKRRRHEGSNVDASGIPDIVHNLIRDFSFQSCPAVYRVLKLCCLVIDLPRFAYPQVSFDLSGGLLSETAFQCFLRLVQTYMMSAG